jgi:lysophospholipase L1-like esterase
MTNPQQNLRQSRVILPGNLVLFQGDSITDAFRKPEEICNAYRMGSGYALMVAAQLLAARPGDGLRFENRGVSGEGIQGLAKRWERDCLDLRPEVLSILVGINDAQVTLEKAGTSLEDYETRYRELLVHTRTVLPAVRLVLCEPFVLQAGDVRADRLADVAERGAIVRRLALEFGAVLVPLQSVFAEALKIAPPDYWSFDGIHPNAQGHWLICEAWLSATAEAGTK